MKNRPCSFLIIPSAFFFCVLISEPSVKGFIYAFIAGIAIGFLLWRLKARYRFSGSYIKAAVDAVITLFLAYRCAGCFRSLWMLSDSLSGILSRISPNTDLLRTVIGYAGALLSLPFIYLVVSNLSERIIVFFRSVKFPELFKKAGFSLRSFGKAALISAVGIIFAAAVGTLLLLAAYCLPVERIEQNTAASAAALADEGDYPSVFSWCRSQLDNWTDSIMLLEAADNTDDTVVNRAMMAYRGEIGQMYPYNVLISHYTAGEEFTGTASYARYWHGYQIFLKPLLEVFSFDQIRILNGTVQALLLLAVCALMYKRNYRNLIIPYFLSYLMLMPVTLGMCMQFSSCYYCISAGVILLLLFSGRVCRSRSAAFVIFLAAGILTAYFDFLTYPLATFGVPAVLYAAMQKQKDPESRFGHMIGNGAAWCAGFGGMWGSKWITASLLTGNNIFADALSAFSYRTSDIGTDGSTSYSLLSCVRKNYLTFSNTPVVLLAAALAVYYIFFIRRGEQDGAERSRITSPYAILALSPVVWFAFSTNHSVIHTFFTSNICVITVIAVLFGLSELKRSTPGVNDSSPFSKWL